MGKIIAGVAVLVFAGWSILQVLGSQHGREEFHLASAGEKSAIVLMFASLMTFGIALVLAGVRHRDKFRPTANSMRTMIPEGLSPDAEAISTLIPCPECKTINDVASCQIALPSRLNSPEERAGKKLLQEFYADHDSEMHSVHLRCPACGTSYLATWGDGQDISLATQPHSEHEVAEVVQELIQRLRTAPSQGRDAKIACLACMAFSSEAIDLIPAVIQRMVALGVGDYGDFDGHITRCGPPGVAETARSLTAAFRGKLNVMDVFSTVHAMTRVSLAGSDVETVNALSALAGALAQASVSIDVRDPLIARMLLKDPAKAKSALAKAQKSQQEVLHTTSHLVREMLVLAKTAPVTIAAPTPAAETENLGRKILHQLRAEDWDEAVAIYRRDQEANADCAEQVVALIAAAFGGKDLKPSRDLLARLSETNRQINASLLSLRPVLSCMCLIPLHAMILTMCGIMLFSEGAERGYFALRGEADIPESSLAILISSCVILAIPASIMVTAGIMRLRRSSLRSSQKELLTQLETQYPKLVNRLGGTETIKGYGLPESRRKAAKAS